ncbi:hypothetical protein ZHAS_00017003 [Anopheles sinensis]|uniref:Uncharacterized protein n=1 Tax=Anopheles sinensis TaxID=74873 RepID=A0A084WFK3_ANOSI|nr:hypothetical protein ZHAS_00017003 [Anopheles sinensis]
MSATRSNPPPSTTILFPLQRAYRRKVRQCLWFVLNLYHPTTGPPCDEAIERRFQHFLSIPVPRTPEEQEALRREQAKAAARRKVAATRKPPVVDAKTPTIDKEGQVRRRKVVLVVRKRTVPRKPPPDEEAGDGRQVANTVGDRREAEGRANERSI